MCGNENVAKGKQEGLLVSHHFSIIFPRILYGN